MVPRRSKFLVHPAAGESTGQGMTEMAKLMKKLPAGFGYQWTGLSYEQQQSGSQALYAYLAALVVVFLCLSALYESWAVPIAVLLVVPLGIIGAVLATYFRGLSNDIYFPGRTPGNDRLVGKKRHSHHRVRQARF